LRRFPLLCSVRRGPMACVWQQTSDDYWQPRRGCAGVAPKLQIALGAAPNIPLVETGDNAILA
jgi:hypothetical protein